jgi:hypothetical protein
MFNHSLFKTVLLISDILAQIRIRESYNGLTNPDPALFVKDLQDANKKFVFFLITF